MKVVRLMFYTGRELTVSVWKMLNESQYCSISRAKSIVGFSEYYLSSVTSSFVKSRGSHTA